MKLFYVIRGNGTYFGVWVRGLIIVCTLAFLPLLLAACSEETGDKPSPKPALYYSEDAFLSRIDKAESLIEVAQVKREFEMAGKQFPSVVGALKDKWDTLLAEHEPIGTICEEADLIDFEYKPTGMQFLFKVNKSFSDDYYISLRAYVEPGNRDLLSRDANKKDGYESWGFAPSPPTSRWPVGEYLLIDRPLRVSQTPCEDSRPGRIIAQPIPYRFVTGFYKPGGPRYGAEVDLGWWIAEPVPENFLLEEIATTNDIFELVKIKRLHDRSSAWSPSVASAFNDSWEILSAKAKPNQPFADEVDLVAFDFRRIGEDRYLLLYLFDVNEAIDRNYRIYIHGYVDDNHLHYLPEERRELKFANWSFAPDPPVSTWRPGEKVLLTTEITARPIPYDLKTGFFLPGVGRHGVHLGLGWQADPGR